jgi:hypothetical protein
VGASAANSAQAKQLNRGLMGWASTQVGLAPLQWVLQ